ncbi:hypothetical protein CsSME_00017104 [Camellia sinensis var. sinensis]
MKQGFIILYLSFHPYLSSTPQILCVFIFYYQSSLGGNIVILKSIIRPTETVAIGVLKSTDASKEVEGEELGPDYWEVHVQVPIKLNESLIRSYGLVKTIGQAIGAHVAWLAPFVMQISQVMDASREYLYK